MRSNWTFALMGAVAAALISPVANAAFVLPTVATYDETVNTNAVDFNASGNALGSTNANDLAGFKALVATAFAANQGGVAQFEPGSDQSQPDMSLTYGTSQAKSLSLGLTTGNFRVQAFASSQTISGSRGFYTGNEAATTFNLNFGTITGGDVGEAVTAIGWTILGRTGYNAGQTFTLTANFSNGTTASQVSGQPVVGTIGNGDTFYGFTAPAGASITGVTVSFTGAAPAARTVLTDDFGFITSVVPEPGTMGLAGIGAAAGLLRRRRRAN